MRMSVHPVSCRHLGVHVGDGAHASHHGATALAVSASFIRPSGARKFSTSKASTIPKRTMRKMNIGKCCRTKALIGFGIFLWMIATFSALGVKALRPFYGRSFACAIR